MTHTVNLQRQTQLVPHGGHQGILNRTAQNGVWILDDFNRVRSEYRMAVPNIVHSSENKRGSVGPGKSFDVASVKV